MRLKTKLVLLFVLATTLPVAIGASAWFALGQSKIKPVSSESRHVDTDASLERDRRVLLSTLAQTERNLREDTLSAAMNAAHVDVLWAVNASTGRVDAAAHTTRVLGDDGRTLVTLAKTARGKPFSIELGPNAHQRILANATLASHANGTPHWIVAGHRASRAATDAIGPRSTRPPLWSWLIAVGLLALGLSILFADRVSGWLQASLGEITAAAGRIGRGDLTATVPETGDASFNATATAFNRMTLDLRDAQDRLRKTERVAAWQEIAKRLAHEIKNPLAPIQLSIETLQKARAANHAEFDAIFEESSVAILQEVGRLKELTDEFGRFARLPKPRPTVFDLDELARQVVALYDGRGVTLETSSTSTQVLADREQIAQVIHNLLRNALESDGTSRVLVGVDQTVDQALLQVQDNGGGIAEEQVAHIFDPYFTTKQSGSGLGLAITERIVTEHHGHIDVRSEPGRTIFTVGLSLRKPG